MKYVLFVCTHNAGRSQMAQAFFERYAPADIRAESAGQEPADRIWPNVVEAMREIGIDLADRRPKKLDLEMQLHADWAITLGCGGACPYVPTMVEDWQIPDPAGLTLEETRPIRDLLDTKIRELVEERIDAIRSDQTAHAIRLQRLLPSLVEEFEGEKTPDEIRACTDAVLSQFDDTPVRSFVLTLAPRRARECLREPECALLAH
jgi:arsenate reductase (thioredoxin)